MSDEDEPRCDTCKGPGADAHFCPYAVECLGKFEECNCCTECEESCLLLVG